MFHNVEKKGIISQWERALRARSGDFWQARGERMVLRLFQAMARRVPAYRDVLQKAHIDPARITMAADIASLPILDKDSYLRHYPLPMLVWDGNLRHQQTVFSATSGSTGAPYYFPRRACQDDQYVLVAELYLRTFFRIHHTSTLYVNCFALGVWIGGLFTYEAVQQVKNRGRYSLGLVNPGTNKAEALKCIKALAPHYDQVIIGGYPPLVKDVLDEGAAQGIAWKKIQLKFVFSAEGFSERFRDYIAEQAGLRNIYKDTLNHYGTVDLGTMAHETPVCVLLRRLALEQPDIYSHIFPGTKKLPTLAQYLPELFYFEQLSGGLVCSAWSGIPLIRYDLKDQGGIWSFNNVASVLSSHDYDIAKEVYRAGIDDVLWRLPFVYVYERKDFSVSLSGANIYPETIRNALLQEKFLPLLTGKCALALEYDDRQNQQLVVHVEQVVGQNHTPDILGSVQEAVIAQLLKENSEYRVLFESRREHVLPKIVVWPYQHPEYFSPLGKQKWVVTKK